MDYSIKDLASGARAMARSVFGKKKEYSLLMVLGADEL